MMITRYLDLSGRPAVGLQDDAGIRPLAGIASVGQLLRLSAAQIRSVCSQVPVGSRPADEVRLLPPVDSLMEVWAAGVTYQRSREARVLESDHAADVYELVYEADRRSCSSNRARGE